MGQCPLCQKAQSNNQLCAGCQPMVGKNKENGTSRYVFDTANAFSMQFSARSNLTMTARDVLQGSIPEVKLYIQQELGKGAGPIKEPKTPHQFADALFNAVQTDDLPKLQELLALCKKRKDHKELLNLRFPLSIQNKYGLINVECEGTLLHCAANLGHFNAAKLLIQADVGAEAYSSSGLQAIHLAASKGSLPIVRLLLAHSTSKNAIKAQSKDESLKQPIHYACNEGHFEIVKFLVERDADINARTAKEVTPIMLAAMRGHEKIVRFLLSRGDIVVDLQDNLGMTALHFAAKAGHHQILLDLITKDADVTKKASNHMTALHFATEEVRVGVVRSLLKTRAIEQINSLSKSVNNCIGSPPLILACMHPENNIESCVRTAYLLIKAGANLEIPHEEGSTALTISIYLGKEPLVKLLLQEGAQLNIEKNEAHQFPIEIVSLQSPHPFALNNKTVINKLHYQIAQKCGNPHVLELIKRTAAARAFKANTLLENKANVDHYAKTSPLQVATKSASPSFKAISTLIEAHTASLKENLPLTPMTPVIEYSEKPLTRIFSENPKPAPTIHREENSWDTLMKERNRNSPTLFADLKEEPAPSSNTLTVNTSSKTYTLDFKSLIPIGQPQERLYGYMDEDALRDAGATEIELNKFRLALTQHESRKNLGAKSVGVSGIKGLSESEREYFQILNHHTEYRHKIKISQDARAMGEYLKNIDVPVQKEKINLCIFNLYDGKAHQQKSHVSSRLVR